MSRFNAAAAVPTTTNFAGGEAYEQSPKLAFISILLTSFMQDNFYESSNETAIRLKSLIDQNPKQLKFFGKCVIYARKHYGMRSITHVAASYLAPHISGESWAKDFFEKVIHRPDDMTEIVAFHKAQGHKMPNAMKKGFAAAFGKFGEYQLAKYRGEGKGTKLVDLVNVVHPIPTQNNADAIKKLVANTLRSQDTWESMMTAAGSDPEKKAVVWQTLIAQKQLPYFALLRNLRNIIAQAPDQIEAAIQLLLDEAAIKKSLVLPFRFITAFDEISKIDDSKQARMVLSALNKAVDISLNNVPIFEGETLVVLDTSGSMQESGSKSPHIIGALLSTVLLKRNAENADFMTFSDNAQYQKINTDDTTMTVSRGMRFAMGGTNFQAIFETAKKKYDRIIIISDMQGWIGYYCPTKAFSEYKKRTGANPFVYSFDLKGYGTMQLPEKNVFALAGFSEKVFDVMQALELNTDAMFKDIENFVAL